MKLHFFILMVIVLLQNVRLLINKKTMYGLLISTEIPLEVQNVTEWQLYILIR